MDRERSSTVSAKAGQAKFGRTRESRPKHKVSAPGWVLILERLFALVDAPLVWQDGVEGALFALALANLVLLYLYLHRHDPDPPDPDVPSLQ
jgi:hypothetical protein